MRFLVSLSGYDAGLVGRLGRGHVRFFAFAAVLVVIAAAGGGVGAAYGMSFPFGPVVGVVVGVGFAAFMLNLVRLVNAGSGYPVHLPIDAIDDWSPTATAAVVLAALGLLLAQPLVLLVLHPVFHATGGLVARVDQCWAHPAAAAAVTAALALVISAPGWLRLVGAGAVRAYERERWIDDRILVDDAFAEAQDAITHLLEGVPGFKPPLQVHYADPPYNTRPLFFGLDPAVVVKNGIKFVKQKDAPPPPPPAEPPGPAARVDDPPRPAPAPPTPPPPPPKPAEVPKAAGGDDVVAASWDDASHDADTETPALAFFDVGRLQAKRAREHADVVAPFVAEFTGLPEDQVRGLIRAAPDEMRVHALFSDYKKLRSILMKDASFALDHGLAPIVSIIVQRPVADVEKRLRAAPPDKRLTGVFAPELARRLLKKKR